MAWETQSSPPVPAATIRNKKMDSSTLGLLRGSWMRVPNDEDAHTNDGNARPAEEIHLFTEEPEPKNRDHKIRERGCWLNVAVIRPGEHQHVGDKEGQQARDTEPNVTGGKNPAQN